MSRTVIIVGGGIVGCSAAYFLAREGAQVTLLEAEEVAYGASGRNPGFVWLHLRSPGFATAASKGSRRLYDEFAAELDDFESDPPAGSSSSRHRSRVGSCRSTTRSARPTGLISN